MSETCSPGPPGCCRRNPTAKRPVKVPSTLMKCAVSGHCASQALTGSDWRLPTARRVFKQCFQVINLVTIVALFLDNAITVAVVLATAHIDTADLTSESII